MLIGFFSVRFLDCKPFVKGRIPYLIMAGTCVTTIKVLGATSLGLLAGNLTYQSVESIPLLINQLKAKVSINSNEILGKVSLVIINTRISNLVLGAISTGFLGLAFIASAPRDKHPYILYSALSVPIGIISSYYKTFKYEAKLLKKSKQVLPVIPNQDQSTEKDLAKKQDSQQELEKKRESDEDSQLGKSYIHVSDEDSSSNTSTPNSSVPNSPRQPASSEESKSLKDLEHELTIEEEVENALYKKEYINDLGHVKSGYNIGSSITGLGFLMVVVGLIGDTFFL